MDPKLLAEAKRLATRPYNINIIADNDKDHGLGYFINIPEMPGCHTDGRTREEAVKNLEELKVEFIYYLLEDGLPIPEPAILK